MRMYENATDVKCPSCGVAAGVWCGPIYYGNGPMPTEAYCHERRVMLSRSLKEESDDR